jgi:poly(3-hydroxybutyrate) depolymerase
MTTSASRRRASRRLASRVLASLASLAVLAACTKRDPPTPAPVPIPTPVGSTTQAPRAAAVTSSSSHAIVLDGASPASAAPPTPGCGLDAPAPRGTAYTTKSGRTFHVWGPSKYEVAQRYPVVLTFHGWYANGRDFQKWFKMEDHVDGAAFTVYPDSKGPTWDLAGNQDLDFAADIVDALAKAYCIDRTRVFALGFSFGGKLVHHLGCKRPGLVRAIAVGDGSWQEESGCRPMPVLVTHRTRDHDELIAWGREAAQRWAKLDGCSDAPEPTDAAHGCVAYRGCTAPGSVTFCEDTHFDSTWPKDWNHTIREEYRSLTWKWFISVP